MLYGGQEGDSEAAGVGGGRGRRRRTKKAWRTWGRRGLGEFIFEVEKRGLEIGTSRVERRRRRGGLPWMQRRLMC